MAKKASKPRGPSKTIHALDIAAVGAYTDMLVLQDPVGGGFGTPLDNLMQLGNPNRVNPDASAYVRNAIQGLVKNAQNNFLPIVGVSIGYGVTRRVVSRLAKPEIPLTGYKIGA